MLPSLSQCLYKIDAIPQEVENLCEDSSLYRDNRNNQTLKLLHLASDTFQGGAESVFRNTIEYSLNCGKFLVYTASCEDCLPYPTRHIKLDDYHDYDKLRGAIKYIYNAKNYHILLDFLHTIQPDIIHTQNYLSRLSPSVLFALKAYKKMHPNTLLVFTEHGFSACANHCFYDFHKQRICESCIHSTKLKILLRSCDRRGFAHSTIKAIRTLFYQGVFLKEQDLFDKIIFVSHFQLDKHLQDGYDKRKTICIPNPIDKRFLNPHISINDKRDIIVFYGRISEEKNVPLLIKSFASLTKDTRFERYKLLIIGNGDDKPTCQNLAKTLLKSSSYEFKSHLTPEELKSILYYAKISIIPSKLYETFGLVIVESILGGAIPIAPNIGALKETIQGYFGYCFDVNRQDSHISLESTMKNVLLDYGDIFEMFIARRKEIIRDLERHSYWNALENLYGGGIG